jgi:hypothetical protein
MRQPTPKEFAELVALIEECREQGMNPDAVRAQCEECWPAEVVSRAFAEVRRR